jgi:predicted phosphate transport protein (TIGR00153 family)
MSLIAELFGKSPFGALVRHTEKVQECVGQVKPLLEACLAGDYQKVHELQNRTSKLEYEADLVKQEIREQLPRRYFLPVSRDDLERFLHFQDAIADAAEDFAVILVIRNTVVHPELVDEFLAFADQVLLVGQTLTDAADELEALAESSFGGAEAKSVLERISGLGEAEWMADRMQRRLSQHIYRIESELDPISILFYDKMLLALGEIANAADRTGDLLRTMILRS